MLDVPATLVALLLAPLATKLPEKFNSVIWISEGRESPAIGNIRGVMVFQGALPASPGFLFTSRDLGVSWGTVGFLNTLLAILALIGGGAVLLRTQFIFTNRMRPEPFLVAGLLYVLLITVVSYHVLFLSVAAGD